MVKFIKILFKIGLYTIGGLFLLGIIAVACSDEDITEDKTKEEKVVKKKKEEPEKVEKPKEVKVEKKAVKEEPKKVKKVVDHKPAVLAFEKEALTLDKTFQPAWNEVQTALQNNDRFGAYDASTRAHNEAKRIWQAYGKLEASDKLPKDVRKLLDEASDQLQLAYYMKKESIESMQKYLDDNKPSDLQDVKEKSNESQIYMLQGVAKITEAKLKVGIE